MTDEKTIYRDGVCKHFFVVSGRSISPSHQPPTKINPADRTQVCETGKRESPPQDKEPEKTVVVGMKEQTGENAKND